VLETGSKTSVPKNAPVQVPVTIPGQQAPAGSTTVPLQMPPAAQQQTPAPAPPTPGKK
jgi:hypothetical protein